MRKTSTDETDRLPSSQESEIQRFARRDLASRLKRLLNERGMTPSEFANKLGVGRQKISSYTTGRSFPKPSMLVAMAKALGVEPKDLHPQAGVTMQSDASVVDFQSVPGNPKRMIVRLNVVLPTPIAIKIMALVNEDVAESA